MCTWSFAIFPLIIINSCSIAICLNKSLALIATSPCNIFFRYFGIHTKCTFKSCLQWLPFRYIFIVLAFFYLPFA